MSIKKFDEFINENESLYDKHVNDTIEDVSTWAKSIGYAFSGTEVEDLNTFYLVENNMYVYFVFNTFFGKALFVHKLNQQKWEAFWPDSSTVVMSRRYIRNEIAVSAFKEQLVDLDSMKYLYQSVFEFLDILKIDVKQNGKFETEWNPDIPRNKNKFWIKYTANFNDEYDFVLEYENEEFRVFEEHELPQQEIFVILTEYLELNLANPIIEYLKQLSTLSFKKQFLKIKKELPGLLIKYRGSTKMKKFGF